jgi:hypothetical protein
MAAKYYGLKNGGIQAAEAEMLILSSFFSIGYMTRRLIVTPFVQLFSLLRTIACVALAVIMRNRIRIGATRNPGTQNLLEN